MRIKNIFIQILGFMGIFRAFAMINKKKLIVLMYHGVTRNHERSEVEDYNGDHIDWVDFKKQMAYLFRYYNVISAGDLKLNIVNGKSLPDNPVLITFDDGYRNNYTTAFPILKSFKFPAIVFISPEFISRKIPLWGDSVIYSLSNTEKESIDLQSYGIAELLYIRNKFEKIKADKEIFMAMLNTDVEARRGVIRSITAQTGYDLSRDIFKYDDYALMSWENLKEMKAAGICVGSHGQNHLCLASLTDSKIQDEARLSTQEIRDKLGEAAVFFAYPWGGSYTYNDSVKKVLKDSGYICAFTSVRGLNNVRAGVDWFELKRIGIEGKADFTAFKAAITGVDQFLMHFKQKIKNLLMFGAGCDTNQ